MKAQRSSYGTTTLFLLLLEIVISASWVIRIQSVEPMLSWEDHLISLLEISERNYQLYKAEVFIVILLILMFRIIAGRKPKKYKLPKM